MFRLRGALEWAVTAVAVVMIAAILFTALVVVRGSVAGPEATFTAFLQALDAGDWDAVRELTADDCKGKDFSRGRKVDPTKPWTEQFEVVRVFESEPYGILWTRTPNGAPYWQLTEGGRVRCTSSW